LGVRAELFQGNWDKLPDLLRAGQIDVVLNGYELTREHAAAMEATKPYYYYGLQLLVRVGGPVRDFSDLSRPPSGGGKWRIGVLTGSAAETTAKRLFGDTSTIASYDGNTDSMREVENDKLDATIQDTPIVSFYLPRFPKLLTAGEPIDGGFYVLYARKGETRLTGAIDEALAALHRDGSLRRLYEKYGLWNDQQSALARVYAPPTAAPSASAPSDAAPAPLSSVAPPEPIRASAPKHGLAVVREYSGILLEAAGMTILLSVTSFPLAVLLGLGVALGRRYGPKPLSKLLGAYVEILRGTPLMLQLFFLFFFLPELGIRMSALATAIVGLSLNYSAYESEIYRAGLQAVPLGQTEAALALGLSRWQAIRRVVVPQASRIVIPPMVNDFIALFKDTSVCSVVTVIELTKRYSVLNMSTQATVELTIMTALLYLAMSFPLAVLSRRLEARLGVATVHA
ncbi:MAG TPA: ABC transporter substrate-binding protein/permease, partial [Polyangiaceae bacterium]|nr:ABC transporter substrate-binding protein/permease [Polyangiaceae bacterium]